MSNFYFYINLKKNVVFPMGYLADKFMYYSFISIFTHFYILHTINKTFVVKKILGPDIPWILHFVKPKHSDYPEKMLHWSSLMLNWAENTTLRQYSHLFITAAGHVAPSLHGETTQRSRRYVWQPVDILASSFTTHAVTESRRSQKKKMSQLSSWERRKIFF